MRSIRFPRTATGLLAGACALAMTAAPGLAQVAIQPMPAAPIDAATAAPTYVEPPLVLGPPGTLGPLVGGVLAAPLAVPGAIVGTQTFAAAPPATAVDPMLEPRLFAAQPQVAARALTLCDDAMLNPHAYSTQTTIECATQSMDGLGDSGND